MQPNTDNSLGEIQKQRITIVQEFVREHSLKVKSLKEVPQVLQMAGYIDAFLLKLENGSLIITLSVKSIDTLEAIQRLYLGGMLEETIRKDLLSEKRRHHILQIVKKNGGKDGDIEDSFFDSLEFNVEICPADFQFCLLNLKAIKGIYSIFIILTIAMLLLFKTYKFPRYIFNTNDKIFKKNHCFL